MSVLHSFKSLLQTVFYFAAYNLFWVLLLTFFAYRTFWLGRLNWAFLLIVLSLFLMIICRVLSYYRENITTTFAYRAAVIWSVGLIIAALCIQILRFIYVFAPGLARPTLPVLLVRIGIATSAFYVCAVLMVLGCYLFASHLSGLLWDGSIGYKPESFGGSKGRQNWKLIHFFASLLVRLFFMGGAVSILMLGLGFLGWLLRGILT